MEIRLPAASANCEGLDKSDFESFKIPEPPGGCKTAGDEFIILLFINSEEALKYAIHLNDVYERMEASSAYDCSRKKIKAIISAINQQVDFKSLDFN